jgi:sugar lactone lactonase YvrE
MLTLLFALACNNGGKESETPVTYSCDEPGVICRYAGQEDGLAGMGAEGSVATETFFYLPQDLTFGPDGNAYVLDWNNHRVRQILTSDKTIHTFAGTGELGDGPEGPATSSKFNHPTNIAFAADGTMYIAAWHNSRIVRVDASGNLDQYCGDGKRAFWGDGGDCGVAELDLPSAVAFDDAGTLYISDMANQRIRTVGSDGIINTWGFDGTAGYAGDGGPVSAAQMHATVGQDADPANRIVIADGILYLADTENQRVRYVDLATGIIDTFAGNGTPGYSGDGGSATSAAIWGPRDIAVGQDGELYIADTENSCVRMVQDDVISTVAGICGEPGFDGDIGPAADAHLQKPFGVAVDADNNLYIADTYNNVIRVVKH